MTVDPDHTLVLAIRKLLDGQEWSSDTLDEIAWLMTEHGYAIREPTNEEEDAE